MDGKIFILNWQTVCVLPYGFVVGEEDKLNLVEFWIVEWKR